MSELGKYTLIKNTNWKEVEVNGEMMEIPSDWKLETIKNLTKVTSGGTPSTQKKEYWDKKEVPWLSSGEVANKNIYKTEKHISRIGLNNSSAKIIPKNTVLIALAGQGKTRGQVALSKIELSTNQSVGAILPSNLFDSKFLFLNLLNRYSELRNLSGGDNGRGGLNLELIKNIHILMPTLHQQSSISAILSHQKSVIEDIESLIEKYEARFRYLSEELLSGRLRVKEINGNLGFYKNPEENWKEVEVNGDMTEIPKDWDISSIRKTITLNMGSTPKKESNNYEGELPWITITNLTNKKISQYTAKIKKTKNIKIFPKGTLLISFKMSVGKAGFTTEDSAINEAIMGIQQQENGNYLDYLYYCLPNIFLKNAMPNGQGLLLLNQEKIKDLNFISPRFSEQSRVASILSNQEDLIQSQKDLLVKEKQKLDWILENLLSGKYLVQENS